MKLQIVLSSVSFCMLLCAISCSAQKKSPEKAPSQPNTVTVATGKVEQRIVVPPLPKEVFFAGEKMPLHDDDVRERLERELILNTHLHSSTLLLLKHAARWREPIMAILKEEGIPLDFFYLAAAESAFNSNAISSQKATGMWQFMPGAASLYNLGEGKGYDERRDPLKSARAACAYLKDSYKLFNNWTLAAAAYNRGNAGMSRALEQQKVKSYYDLYLNAETSRYVFRIVALKLIIEKPEQYGFYLAPEDMYKPFATQSMTLRPGTYSAIDLALQNGTTYKEVRRLNPWITDYSFTIKQEMTLLLPK